jgi:hypothetical protein
VARADYSRRLDCVRFPRQPGLLRSINCLERVNKELGCRTRMVRVLLTDYYDELIFLSKVGKRHSFSGNFFQSLTKKQERVSEVAKTHQ